MQDPWLLVGGFNDIAGSNEKKGGAPASVHKCRVFRDRINDCKLINLETAEPKFTWRGLIFHGGYRIYEKLDRALSNEAWSLNFLDAQIKTLTHVEFSDHHPILISLTKVMKHNVPRQFRFESAWLAEAT
ncbi:unnamed protein product [Lathyrus sativus]|nr:unnamed protein product [Lathyrus sativus]